LKCNKQAKKQKNQSSFAEINLNGRITKLNGKRERERERERERDLKGSVFREMEEERDTRPSTSGRRRRG
jgi:hypothetical protein